MTITGKHTVYGMESWFLVPKQKLSGLIPEGLSVYAKLGLGSVVIGVWNHSNAYVDDRSYGPVLEAWAAVGVTYKGKMYGYVSPTYNNSPSYAEPVNDIFKFTKIQAGLEWRERDGIQEVEVKQDGKPVLRFSGHPTFIPITVPFSTPRLCLLIKDNERFAAEVAISPGRSRLAITSVDIPADGPLGELGNAIKSGFKYSVFYEDTSIVIPVPIKI